INAQGYDKLHQLVLEEKYQQVIDLIDKGAFIKNIAHNGDTILYTVVKKAAKHAVNNDANQEKKQELLSNIYSRVKPVLLSLQPEMSDYVKQHSPLAQRYQIVLDLKNIYKEELSKIPVHEMTQEKADAAYTAAEERVHQKTLERAQIELANRLKNEKAAPTSNKSNQQTKPEEKTTFEKFLVFGSDWNNWIPFLILGMITIYIYHLFKGDKSSKEKKESRIPSPIPLANMGKMEAEMKEKELLQGKRTELNTLIAEVRKKAAELSKLFATFHEKQPDFLPNIILLLPGPSIEFLPTTQLGKNILFIMSRAKGIVRYEVPMWKEEDIDLLAPFNGFLNIKQSSLQLTNIDKAIANIQFIRGFFITAINWFSNTNETGFPNITEFLETEKEMQAAKIVVEREQAKLKAVRDANEAKIINEKKEIANRSTKLEEFLNELNLSKTQFNKYITELEQKLTQADNAVREYNENHIRQENELNKLYNPLSEKYKKEANKKRSIENKNAAYEVNINFYAEKKEELSNISNRKNELLQNQPETTSLIEINLEETAKDKKNTDEKINVIKDAISKLKADIEQTNKLTKTTKTITSQLQQGNMDFLESEKHYITHLNTLNKKHNDEEKRKLEIKQAEEKSKINKQANAEKIKQQKE
ncbi:MAG: hypothetical protein ACK4ON_07930, partial [Bacteroidia bacterium]